MKRSKLIRRPKKTRKAPNWRKSAALPVRCVSGPKSGQKRPSESKIKKELTQLCALIVKNRDNYTCQKCLLQVSGSNCHCSHVIPVSAGNKLRWDTQNMKVLCYHHHIGWWHKNPLEAGDWFKATFPDRWDYLQRNKGMIQLKYGDYVIMLDALKTEWQDLLEKRT